MTIKAIATALLITGAALAAPASAHDHKSDKTITAIASGSEDFETLTAAVVAAGLADTLAGEGPYTVFAPTDAAFAKLPDGTLDTLLAEPGLTTLTSILTYHVVAGDFKSGELIAAANRNGSTLEVDTVGGGTLTAKVKNGKITLEDGQGNMVGVVKANINASNGTIHVIDSVLLP